MRTMNWDAVAAAAPLDRQASTVRDGSGEHDTPRRLPNENYVHSETPLPVRAPLPNSVDLTGRGLGRMVVIGLAPPKGGRNVKAAWVVRCACGRFEHRTAKYICNPAANADACCIQCDRVDRLRRLGSSRSTRASRESEASFLDRLASAARERGRR